MHANTQALLQLQTEVIPQPVPGLNRAAMWQYQPPAKVNVVQFELLCVTALQVIGGFNGLVVAGSQLA